MPTADQGATVVQQLGQTYRVIQNAFSDRVGHPVPRWRILYALHEMGITSQKALAQRCRLDPASLTRQLQAMEKQGWVRRSTDVADNRLTNATLTAGGRSVVEETLPRRSVFLVGMLDGLSDEQIAALGDLLKALERNVGSGAADESGPVIEP